MDPGDHLTAGRAALRVGDAERALLAAAHGNQDAMDGFASVVSGALSPEEYFSVDNIARIMHSAVPVAG